MLLFATVAHALPDIDKPLKTGERAANEAALVIGNETYAHVGDVPYAARDADAFYRYLVYTRGVPTAKVRLLKGANDQMIKAAAEEVGKLDADTVWVFYAGHGAASPSTGERLLLGDDVRPDPATFESRAVKVEELRTLAGGDRVTLVLDTCYTGKGRAGDDLTGGSRLLVPTYAAQTTGVEWAAASGDQVSKPLDAVQHGAFTYFAIGALRGWADADGDGMVMADEAQSYVQQALGAAQITGQTPTLSGGTGRVLGTAHEEAPVIDAAALTVVNPIKAMILPGSQVTLADLEKKQKRGKRNLAIGGVAFFTGYGMMAGGLFKDPESAPLIVVGALSTATGMGLSVSGGLQWWINRRTEKKLLKGK